MLYSTCFSCCFSRFTCSTKRRLRPLKSVHTKGNWLTCRCFYPPTEQTAAYEYDTMATYFDRHDVALPGFKKFFHDSAEVRLRHHCF